MIVQEHVSLHDKNWFATGGPARFFAEPRTTDEFQHVLSFARMHSLDVFILGMGANILVADSGFDGLVIRPYLKSIYHIDAENALEYAYVHAQAGVSMDDLIVYCLQHNLIGLEEFSGIPGTVGGSMYINLHYFQALLEHFLINAQVIDASTGNLLTVDKEWFAFGYNQSTLQKKEHYLVSATFGLKKVSAEETAYARGRRTEIIRHRTARYPTHYTCGSFFRNFYDHEVTLTSGNKKLIWVAYYLDKIGVKGELRVGNAVVSYQHANMIVHDGTATSNDIVTLARHMQDKVYNYFNITPQPECQLIGFKEYPLR